MTPALDPNTPDFDLRVMAIVEGRAKDMPPCAAKASGGAAIGAVKAHSRLPDAVSVDPAPPVQSNFTNPMCIATGPCERRPTRSACHGCTMVWAEQPREDQRRRWAEAIAASEARVLA